LPLAQRGDMRSTPLSSGHELMSETPPDRLSADPKSPHYDEALLERGVGVRFKGVEKTNVEEYCVSEKWVRVAAGNTMARNGRPVTLKMQGDVEVWFRDKVEGT
jgi:hypothetical protein